MSNTTTRIEVSKEYLHFAAAHFTIFNASERERLHGHNFHVQAVADSPIKNDGLAFDYNVLKTAIKRICDSWDEYVLLPTKSPHLRVWEDEEGVHAQFNEEHMRFLASDVQLLPVRNITVEELAGLILELLREDASVQKEAISHLEIKVSSGAGQWASATWEPA